MLRYLTVLAGCKGCLQSPCNRAQPMAAGQQLQCLEHSLSTLLVCIFLSVCCLLSLFRRAHLRSRFSLRRSFSSALLFLSFLLFALFSTGVRADGFAFGNLNALPFAAPPPLPASRLRHQTKPATTPATNNRAARPACGSCVCLCLCFWLLGGMLSAPCSQVQA